MRLYEFYGEKSFSMLDGMFAFSIYDKLEKKILLVRDFFGEKPLYYKKQNGSLIWSSELKSIIELEGKGQISETAIRLFFALNFIPAPHTIYREIKKVPPNSFLKFDISKGEYSLKTIKTTNIKNQSNSIKILKDKTRKLIMDTVSSRSISDVPLGSFLSAELILQ